MWLSELLRPEKAPFSTRLLARTS